MLIVSDMHLDKGRSYRTEGTLLPPYDTVATLARLAELLACYHPQRVTCLGDTFHNAEMLASFSASDHFQLSALVNDVKEWWWISGNHDPMTNLPFPGHVAPSVDVHGLHLTHGDHPLPPKPCLLGHFHPKDSTKLLGRKITGPCFAWNHDRMVLPAFGAYTGGLDVNNPTLQVMLGPSAWIGLVHGRTVGTYRYHAESTS
jgi:DNA ligase-associated metallophosphoesterase